MFSDIVGGPGVTKVNKICLGGRFMVYKDAM